MTTIDAGTRVGRFLVQDLLGHAWKPLGHTKSTAGNLIASTAFVGAAAAANTRLPAGHPEGYLEAFANIYRNFADALSRTLAGRRVNAKDCDFPIVHDGVRGMLFLGAVVKSAAAEATWV